MFRAFKFRLYPNKSQQELLAKHFGCVRWVYNKGLSMKIESWTKDRKNPSRFDLQANLPAWKSGEFPWLKEVNAQSLQASLVNLDMAYTRFFKEKKGFPKFKNKHSRQSFQVPQTGEVGNTFVKIPKVGKIKARISQKVDGKLKSITISKTPTGKYFASVLVDNGKSLPEKLPITEAGIVGIDLGLTHFATLSTGEKIENPRLLQRQLKRLKRNQRKFSKKKRGSNNKAKQRLVVARIHEKISNQRKDFLHKLTSKLCESQADSFAIEDLNVKDMMKNRHLSRSISDASWGMFKQFLKYKAEWNGKNVLEVGRFEPSSKICSSCGVINHNLKLSQRVWKCECGVKHDRDINAAINIKNIGRGTPEFTPLEICVSESVNEECFNFN